MVDARDPDPALLTTEIDPLRKVLEHLAARVRKEQMETWFRSLRLLREDAREVELTVTTPFVRDWLTKNYFGVLQEAIDSLGGGKRRLVLSTREEDGWNSMQLVRPSAADQIAQLLQSSEHDRPARVEPLAIRSIHPPVVRLTSPQLPVAPPKLAGRRLGNPLNPNYTFDRFVVGTCNRIAHASALAVGENPGCAFNPLFVHGNVGLGKTHLLQAICHLVLRRDPHARVVYMSCEDFTNTFIQSLQNQQIDTFRDFLHEADVLVIDDVQFLANKEKTQREFFHTFNALYDAHRQIVLSSDRPPVEIPTLEECLVSRFKWGFVTDVEAPCIDTRVAIVRHKAAGRGVELPEDVAQYLASRVTSNIRELEGVVIKVVGFAAITGQPITLALAEHCLRGIPMRRSQISSEDVMNLITTEFAITTRELIGKSRTQTVSLPRQIAMFLLREHTESSLEDIGRIFGNRDHTTVIYGVNKMRERLQKDRMFKELLDGLSSRLMTRSARSS